MQTAIITFKNGLQIETEVNGSCFITDTKPDFPEDLSGTVVNFDGEERIYEHAEVIECASVDDRYWFAFYEPSPEAIRQRQLDDAFAKQQSNIDYLSMMTSIEL